MHYELLTKEIIPGKKTKIFENDDFKVYWEGFLFIRELAPGQESIENFVNGLKKELIRDRCQILSGIFTCIIHNKKEDIIYSFSDNSGIQNLFKSPKFMSTSFLDTIKLNQLSKSDIIPEKVVDFIISQSSMGWKTIFRGIEKIQFDIIIVDNGTEIKYQNKNLYDVFKIKHCPESIIERMGKIVKTLKQVKGKICVDLSGGYDGRMISTILKYHGLNFESGIAGVPNYPDVYLSKEIAKRIDVKHHILYHAVNSNTLEKELEDCFIDFDGCMDIIAWNRPYQLQKFRVKNNYVLNITGHSGELYKPFPIWKYNDPDSRIAIKNLINAEALSMRYGLGFKVIPHNIFSKDYKKLSLSYKERITNTLLNLYGNDKSGKVLAKIYYYFMECGRIATGHLIDRYSPLLDKYIVPCGITLKGGKKKTIGGAIKLILIRPWDNRYLFESKITTSLNKKAAKVRIADALDYSASSTAFQQVKGLINHYIISHFREKKERILNLNPNYYPTARTLNKTDEMIELLKREGILEKSVSPESIPDMNLGGAFTIGKLIEFCEN
ncbi:MAG: hypothetical protein ACFFAF_00545 [Candidatus Hermodarchaeota archaeon]